MSDQGVCVSIAEDSAKAGLGRRAIAILSARHLPCLLALSAVLISLPALDAGLITDDTMHQAMLAGDSSTQERLAEVGLAREGSSTLREALADLFVVVDPDRHFKAYRDYGVLPWWTYGGYRVAHWRPVASPTHWLDYRLFPNTVWLMHLHSILWFAAAVLLAAILYRRFIDVRWIAGLAGLLYLVNNDAYFPTMWLANRNLLISVCFGILTLIVHDRWRRDGWKPGAILVPLCLLASVLATEGGVATFAYLLAYEMTLGTGRSARRLLALAPSLIVIVLWRLVYNSQGYGAAGSGFYLDPVRQPLAFMVAAVERLPFLLAGQWTTLPPDLYGFLPSAGRTVLTGLLALIAIVIPLCLWPLLERNRRMKFWLLGMILAALPICATIPMGRALLFVAIGAFGLIAECIGVWYQDADRLRRWGRSGRWLAMMVMALLIAHLPLALAMRPGTLNLTGKVINRLNRTAVIGLYERYESGQRLVIVNAPNPATLMWDPFWAAGTGQSLPAGLRTLAPGFGPLEVARTGPRRLVIRSLQRSLLTCRQEFHLHRVFLFSRLSDVRGVGHPMAAGQRITLPGLTVEVLAVDEAGSPSEAAFAFDVPLEDRTLRWIYWDWPRRHFVVFSPPPVGQVVRLDGPF